jgi:hypothetical protein
MNQPRSQNTLVFLLSLLILSPLTISAQIPDFRQALKRGDFAQSVREYKQALGTESLDYQHLAEMGVLQCLEALEHLAQQWLAHQTMVVQGFPVEVGPKVGVYTYRSFRRFLKVFYRELQDARLTLAKIPPTPLNIPFSYSDLAMDFNADGQVLAPEDLGAFFQAFPLIQVRQKDQRRVFFLDYADLLWLRSSLGFVQGGMDLLLSYDWEEVFYQWDGFIRLDTMGNRRYPKEDFFLMHSIFPVQENRFPQAREHILRSLRLGQAMWEAIALEEDDAGEWIPGTHQTNWRTDISLSQEKIRRLLAIQNQLIRFLEGTDLLELYPGMTINLAWFLEHPRTINLNNPLRPLLSSREAGQGVRLIELFDLVQGLGNDWLPFLIWVN